MLCLWPAHTAAVQAAVEQQVSRVRGTLLRAVAAAEGWQIRETYVQSGAMCTVAVKHLACTACMLNSSAAGDSGRSAQTQCPWPGMREQYLS